MITQKSYKAIPIGTVVTKLIQLEDSRAQFGQAIIKDIEDAIIADAIIVRSWSFGEKLELFFRKGFIYQILTAGLATETT